VSILHDRDAASTLGPTTGLHGDFHSPPQAPPPAWRRALRRLRTGHPTLRLSLVAVLLWALGAWHITVRPIEPLTRLELALDDVRQSTALAPVPAPRDDIVIVDIDDASLRALGRWPWPRDRIATLVDTLFAEDHVAALGIDLVLAEPDDQARSVRAALSSLTRLAPEDAALRASVARWQGTLEARADHDALLAQALSGRAVTLAYHFNHESDAAAPGSAAVVPPESAQQAQRELPPPVTEADVLPASALSTAPWQGVEVPVAPLLRGPRAPASSTRCRTPTANCAPRCSSPATAAPSTSPSRCPCGASGITSARCAPSSGAATPAARRASSACS